MTNDIYSGTSGSATPTDTTATGSEGSAGASGVKDEAMSQGRRVAGTAKDETKAVASEAGHQVRKLVSQAGEELRGQAASQQQRVADGLGSVASQFSSMADGATEGGMAADLVRAAGQRVEGVSRWIGDRSPGDLLGEVKRFARRRPGVFLAIAVGAGVLAGRLTRSLAESAADQHRGGGSSDGGDASRGLASSGSTTTGPGGLGAADEYDTAVVETGTAFPTGGVGLGETGMPGSPGTIGADGRIGGAR